MSITTLAEARAVAHTLSSPSKMPGYGYSIPAFRCKIGSLLRQIKGTVCNSCYALKGRYVFPVVKDAMERRFSALSHPQWVEAMVFQILLVNSKVCYVLQSFLFLFLKYN